MRAAAALRSLVGPIELLHEQAGTGLLRLARIGLYTLWIVKLLLDPLWRLAVFPHELYRPLGPLALLPRHDIDLLFSRDGLIFLWVFTLFLLVRCLLERRFVGSSTLAAIFLTIYSCVIRSFGPAVHTDIILLLATYAMAGFAWADHLSARSTRPGRSPDRRAAYPLITIVALLCISYSLVGLNRLLVGGVGVFTGDTMEVWAVDAGLRAYYFDTGLGWRLPQWPLVVFFLRLGLPVVTLFEIAAPLCLVWPRFRWVFLPVMASFHLLSLVLMNIFFFDDLLLYLLLIDWSRHYPALRERRIPHPGQPLSPAPTP